MLLERIKNGSFGRVFVLFDKINAGPFSGEAPPGSVGLDTSTPQLLIAGTAGTYVPASGGLGGGGAQLTAATSITVTNSVHKVTGATAIATIVVGTFGAINGMKVTLIPVDASGQSTTTGGNIALGSTLVQFKALELTFDGTLWYPSY